VDRLRHSASCRIGDVGGVNAERIETGVLCHVAFPRRLTGAVSVHYWFTAPGWSAAR